MLHNRSSGGWSGITSYQSLTVLVAGLLVLSSCGRSNPDNGAVDNTITQESVNNQPNSAVVNTSRITFPEGYTRSSNPATVDPSSGSPATATPSSVDSTVDSITLGTSASPDTSNNGKSGTSALPETSTTVTSTTVQITTTTIPQPRCVDYIFQDRSRVSSNANSDIIFRWPNLSMSGCSSTEEWKQASQTLHATQDLSETETELFYSALYLKCLDYPDAAACSDVNYGDRCRATFLRATVSLNNLAGNPGSVDADYQTGWDIPEDMRAEAIDIMSEGLSECADQYFWDQSVSWLVELASPEPTAPTETTETTSRFLPTTETICEFSISAVCELEEDWGDE